MAMLPPHLGIYIEYGCSPVHPKPTRPAKDPTCFNKTNQRLQGWQGCRYVGKYVPFPEDVSKNEAKVKSMVKAPVSMKVKSSKHQKRKGKKKCLVFDTMEGRKMISPSPVKVSLSPARQPPKSPPTVPRFPITRPEPVTSSPRRSKFPYIALLDASARVPLHYLNALCSSSSQAASCSRFSALPYLKALSEVVNEYKQCGPYVTSLLLC